MAMALPQTPIRTGQELHQLIESLNEQFALDLPNPRLFSPSVEQRNEQSQSLRWRIYWGFKRLYYSRKVDLNDLINKFEEWVVAQPSGNGQEYNSRNGHGGYPSKPSRQQMAGIGRRGPTMISQEDRDARLGYFLDLIDDEIYFLSGGNSSLRARNNRQYLSRLGQSKSTIATSQQQQQQYSLSKTAKRRYSDEDEDEDEDEFHTAPNSPVKKGTTTDVDEFPDSMFDKANWTTLDPTARSTSSLTGCINGNVAKSPRRGLSSFVERLTAPDPPPSLRYDPVPTEPINGPQFSFPSTTGHAYESHDSGLGVSFTSNAPTERVTEPWMDPETQYEDSVVGHMLSQEMKTTFSTEILEGSFDGASYSIESEIVSELLHKGPFSNERSFPRSIPLRYRYELERIGRAWNVPFNRMLVGNNISLTFDEFWKWIAGHNQRNGQLLPERSSRRAWDAAMGSFRTGNHSEVVVFSGDLDWCEPDEPGILKLRLHPLKIEKTCRFHRRFGSDRFLSLSLPPPTQPPPHRRLPSQPTLLLESLASWLTQNVHRCIGRTWQPFFVEEFKPKKKIESGLRFKVEFFAVDGEDFDHGQRMPPSIASVQQKSESRTPMSLGDLMDWHMPREPNLSQLNCKLFQRISLGLSKTFATAVLRPSQILRLHHDPDRNRVMNDGCALMSRALAKRISDSLGISGTTPSCFQARIAGAKGLWMVDRHQSHLSVLGDDDIWIQVSDSQLKIEPHPQNFQDPLDDEQLTFEVVKWSKPLHPVKLNVQLLRTLEHGGGIKEYIAELTRKGINDLYRDFFEVLESNSNVLCRSLIQKIRPTEDSSGLMALKGRRLEQWTANDTEWIIRFTEAGFAPQSFYPLRKRLGRCLRDLLERYVDELRIEVPLSTYAFCIADPYGVLKPDEVHFGFSNNWQGDYSGFEDNLLDDMDVLVGRLPAHLPSDIQRRRAVWKPELRHFKDVIVFSTQGDTPLAHMLSGGDYDGDTPWVCWDQKIVQSFCNSDLPKEEYKSEYFGLTEHSVPMKDIQTREEFWHRAFTFNLTLLNLGRCTMEHERISYDESIDSPNAKELACLLGHLVDSRKAGVHLSEQAWKEYRKRISPLARELPAYRNCKRRYKPSNIIDYLKLCVASHQRDAVLQQLEQHFPEAAIINQRDEDLVRPWNGARQLLQRDGKEGDNLHTILTSTLREVNPLKLQWGRSFSSGNDTTREPTLLAREAVEQAKAIPPPPLGPSAHPLLHMWHYSPDTWQRVLASYAYQHYPDASFVIHTFGDTLCQIKASMVPARTVTNEILACYRLNQKAASQMTACEVPDDGDGDLDEYEGEDAIEAILCGAQQVRGEYYHDLDDTMSVE